MFEPTHRPRIFAMAPGVDFPETLADGLIGRMAGRAPEDMARVTIYLNTATMREKLISAFLARKAGFLPRLRLVTDIGKMPRPDLLPIARPLRQRLELSVLVARLIEVERGKAPGVDAYDLAVSLHDLMEEMQDLGIQPDALQNPGLSEDQAEHWQRSLRFLQVIQPFFAAEARPSAAARQRLMIEHLVGQWAAQPPSDPIILAGSTGSRGSTALLMEAVARLPQGAVILPGFDWDMPEFGWNSLYSGPVPNEDHPQFRYARLMKSLGLKSTDVGTWHGASAPDRARNRLISLALRPA
ncbi:MAG: double-strand break repair protein AddB, partial [Paracoccaceae bacterium]